MLWWHWLLLGLVLTALELAASGGFYIVFFGVAAIIVSLLVAARTSPGRCGFSCCSSPRSSVASLLFFRNPLMRRLNLTAGTADIDTLAGETGTVLEAMAPGAQRTRRGARDDMERAQRRHDTARERARAASSSASSGSRFW